MARFLFFYCVTVLGLHWVVQLLAPCPSRWLCSPLSLDRKSSDKATAHFLCCTKLQLDGAGDTQVELLEAKSGEARLPGGSAESTKLKWTFRSWCGQKYDTGRVKTLLRACNKLLHLCILSIYHQSKFYIFFFSSLLDSLIVLIASVS